MVRVVVAAAYENEECGWRESFVGWWRDGENSVVLCVESGYK